MIIIGLLCLICSAVSELPPAPVPYCSSRPILPKLPLTTDQILTVDLTPYFQGYNLDIFPLPNSFSYLSPKDNLQAQLRLNISGQPINYHLSHNGNQWSKNFLLITNDSESTVAYYGQLSSKHHVPTLQKNVTFVRGKNKQCYDAVHLQDQNTIVLDCSYTNLPGYSNFFMLFNDQTGQFTGIVNNSLFTPFSWISKRRLLRYYQNTTGYDYLLRVYLADGVDSQHSNNTYMEIIKAVDLQLETVGVVDYTQLGWSTLSIMDAMVYKNQIFLLDFDQGLLRLELSPRGRAVQTRFYPCQFFEKFAVYSDDMNDKLIVVLANKHTIHEMMWTDSKPSLITKYSMIRNSTVQKVQINRQYLVVQSSVQVQTQYKFQAILNYTWVFIRGSRVYTNVYRIYSHSSDHVFMDLNLQDSYVMLINRTQILNYQLMKPILTFNGSNSTVKEANAIISVRSSDFINPNVSSCTKVITVAFVEKDDMSIWPGLVSPSQELFMNYPGQLLIQLDGYALGPNITYEYKSITKNQGQHYVLKQNKTKISVDFNISQSVTLLHTDVIPSYMQNTIQLYVQDRQNNTYISTCHNPWQTSSITCTLNAHYKHQSGISSFATIFYSTPYQQQYIYIFNLQNSKHVIKMFLFETSQSLGEIRYPEGLEGEVGHIEANHGMIFVTLPKMKKVDVYRISDCDGVQCKVYVSLTVNLMKAIGVEYFAPRKVRTVTDLEKILFIECLDQLVIIDIFSSTNIRLLKELSSDATESQNFKIALNKNYIVIVSPPDIIEEYRMFDLSSGVIKYHKNLPIYNYWINRAFDLEFNDKGNLFYLTGRDKIIYSQSVVLVYRLGTTYVNSLYDVIFVPGTGGDFELEVSGGYVDFVTIVQDRNLMTLKEYEYPVMVLENEDSKIVFNLQAKNSKQSAQWTKITVNIANYPDNFNKSKGFPVSTANYFTEKIKSRYTWSDHNWFVGHILGYYHKCAECPQKLTFESHMLEQRQFDLQAEDYYRSQKGGYLLWQDVFRLFINGSVRSIETLPKPNSAANQVCRKIVVDPAQIYVVSVCSSQIPEVNIYLTSYASRKGFTMGPWRSQAKAVANLAIINGIMMLVDVNINLEARLREGTVYLYSLNLEGAANMHFLELEAIDTNDLAGAYNYPADDVFIGNAHIIYDSYMGRYKLFITEVRYGLFVVIFQWLKGSIQINIESVDFIAINSVINDKNLHMPSDAIFVGVTHFRTIQSEDSATDDIVVTTRNFHNFELRIIYLKDRVAFCSLTKLYHRYGYYLIENNVKSFNGFLVAPYIIPPVAEVLTNFSRQVVGLYDMTDYPEDDTSKGYKQRYFIAGHSLDTKVSTSFDFNQTYRSGDDILGLVIVDPKNKIISENKISKNLSIVVKDETYLTQNMYLWPYSDFHQLMFELTIVGQPDRSLTGWQIFFIVFGSIVGCIALFLFGRYLLAKWKVHRKKTYLLEEDEGSGEQEDNNIPDRINASVRESVPESDTIRNTLTNPLLPDGYSSPNSIVTQQQRASEIQHQEPAAEVPIPEAQEELQPEQPVNEPAPQPSEPAAPFVPQAVPQQENPLQEEPNQQADPQQPQDNNQEEKAQQSKEPSQ